MTDATLGERIAAATGRGGTVTFVGSAGAESVEWARVHDDARAVAATLQARGVGPGDHVALLGPTSRPLVTALQAVWLAGAVSTVLPLPYRMGALVEIVAEGRRRIRDAGVVAVLIDPVLSPLVAPVAGDPPFLALPDLMVAGRGRPDRFEEPPTAAGDLAVLQYTSGTTGAPRGVHLRQEAILENLDAVATAALLDPETDVLVSWLPLYHDMGLMGLLTLPMMTGADLVLAAPQDFLAAPGLWAQWMSDFAGTITAGPDFSYALLGRALTGMGQLDLSRWRIALNGAELIDPDNVEAFAAAGARHRLSPAAVLPAYGLAEVVIGATIPEPGRGMLTDTVDRDALATARQAVPAGAGFEPPARRLALLGRPVRGIELRVCEPVKGDVLGEREVGELELRGPSVTAGYHGGSDVAASVHDGWLRTGDMGYLVDGELVVCGRLQDVIEIAGRHVYPEVVERAAAGAEGVRAGNVAAFGVESEWGQSDLVVVAEAKGGDPTAVRRQVAERVDLATGFRPAAVVLVAPGTLPKTTSGKLQRTKSRDRYLDRELESV